MVEAFGDTVFDTVITRTVRFPETTVAGEPITTWAPTLGRRHRLPPPRPRGAGAHRRLAPECRELSASTLPASRRAVPLDPASRRRRDAHAEPAVPGSVRSVPVRPTASAPGVRAGRRRPSRDRERRTSVGERHDEKITVYCLAPRSCSDLERPGWRCAAEHGLAVDRGRIVREAIAVVLADLEADGEESILVRRLRAA